MLEASTVFSRDSGLLRPGNAGTALDVQNVAD